MMGLPNMGTDLARPAYPSLRITMREGSSSSERISFGKEYIL
jgi:hypothetical protein